MKTIITTLLILLTLNSYSQEYTFTSEPITCVKLDSLIWKKINEYRTTDHAIIGNDMRPDVITTFGYGKMREYCYEVTMRNSKLPHLDIRHSTYEEITTYNKSNNSPILLLGISCMVPSSAVK